MTVFLDYPSSYSQFIDQIQLETIALATIKHEGIYAHVDLSVVIADDARLQQLNREFLGLDEPTDVLSFPAGYKDPDTNQMYLGDVIISFPTAKRQADQAGHQISSEICLLVVHGILHLLGHDHVKSKERLKMWAAQDEIFETIGLDIKSPGTEG